MKFFLVSIICLLACTANKSEVDYYGEKEIQVLLNKTFLQMKKVFKDGDDLVFFPDSQVGMLGCSDSIYLFEKQYLPLSLFRDSVYIIFNKSNTIMATYNNKFEKPISIIFEPYFYNARIVAIGKNILLGLRTDAELDIKGFDKTYYYITEGVRDSIVLGKTKAAFRNKNCEMKYQDFSARWGITYISEYGYSETRNYLAKVMYVRKKTNFD